MHEDAFKDLKCKRPQVRGVHVAVLPIWTTDRPLLSRNKLYHSEWNGTMRHADSGYETDPAEFIFNHKENRVLTLCKSGSRKTHSDFKIRDIWFRKSFLN